MKHIAIPFMLIAILNSPFSTILAQQPKKQVSSPQKQDQRQRAVQKSDADKQSPEKTLTLIETKDWLREKISGYAGATTGQGNATLSYRYNSVGFERNNTIRLSVTTKAAVPGMYQATTNANYVGTNIITSTNNVTLALRDIDPSKIKVNKLPDEKSFGVMLNTVDGKNKIFVKSSSSSNLKTYPAKPQELFPMFLNAGGDASGAFNKLTLIFPEKEIADQVANAFIHAVNLSLDESEPFVTNTDGSKKNGAR
jgi:hypothetical protein